MFPGAMNALQEAFNLILATIMNIVASIFENNFITSCTPSGKRCLQHLIDAGLMAVACQCLVFSASFLTEGPTVLTEDLYATMCNLLCKIGVKGKLTRPSASGK